MLVNNQESEREMHIFCNLGPRHCTQKGFLNTCLQYFGLSGYFGKCTLSNKES